MPGIVRLTAIALCFLVFAVVLSICGEAVACGGCAHACCVKTDRSERRRDVVGQIVRACRQFVPEFSAMAGVRALPALDRPGERISLPLLVSTVAQLRI